MPPRLASRMALVPLLAALLSGANATHPPRAVAASESITCTNVSSRRVISVVRDSDAPLPCSVRYQKEPEGTAETPWRARRDPNFCAQQVNHLAQVLVNVGWICDPAPKAASEAPALADRPAAEAAIDVAAPPAPLPRAKPERGKSAPAPPPLPAPEPFVEARIPDRAAPERVPAVTDPSRVRQSNTRRWIFARDKARIAADPRLRFYSGRYGVESVADALEIQAVDLNEDGAPEVFLRVTLDGVCGDAPCRWRLYTIAPGLRLASLGLREVREWRLLPTSTAGYRDLWIAADDSESDEMIARFVGSTGMYQREATTAQAALPEASGGDLQPQ